MADLNLAHIIERVTQLIADPDFDKFDEDEIEMVLEQRRQEARYLKLVEHPTRASGGTITYKIYTAPGGLDWWALDSALLNYNYDVITPDTADYRRGRWEFDTQPVRPVYITGFSYDVYAAAADLLEQRAAEVAEDLQSISLAHGTFTYANKRSGPLEMAARYRRRQRQSVGVFYRTDVNP